MEDRFEFTEEQKKAIEHEKGHLRIIACAGSGKTEVISQRIARLIQKGVRPKNIVAFTFTEKAADELKSRIRKILDEKCPERADFGDMYVGTIHSFCFYMLKELEPKYKSYDVLDEAKRVAYIAKYMNFKRMNLFPLLYSQKTGKKINYYTAIDRFIYSADIMMMEDVDPNKLTGERFKYSYLEYRKMLEEDKYLDFSSMIHTLVHLLRNNKKTLQKFNDKIKHLVLDEYQDVNKLQEALVELISLGAESVCVVGDDDQCIYQWRGSHVDNIIGFKDRYQKYGVVDVPLDINFRSTEAIVCAAENFIKKNKKRLTIKEMKHSPKLQRIYEEGDIIHKHFKTEDEEFGFIVSRVEELLGADFLDKRNKPFSLSLGDFAVLVRTNADAGRIIPYFERKGIDCIAYSGNSVFDRNEVILAMNCIGYVFNCKAYSGELPPLLNVLKVEFRNLFDKKKFPEADENEFVEKLQKIKEEIDKIREKSPKDYLGELGLQAVYHKIVNAFGAEKFYFGEVFNYNLAVLSTAISDYESVWIRLRAEEVKGFFYFVYAYGQSHYVEVQHSDASLVNAVKVLTVHKAKGLEFPVVFVPGLVEKRPQNPVDSFVDYKLYDIERYNGTIEDERRIFYTAITRSEKYLFLTGSVKRDIAQKSYEPHKFIGELDKKFVSDKLALRRLKSGHLPKINTGGIYPTSFSELTTYDRCPHDFRLRHVFGYNAGVPAAFGYGTNIHNILNVIHTNYIDEKRIPSDQEIDYFFEQLFKLRYATEKISDNMKKAGKEIVKNYVKLHKDEFKYILETEKNFEFVIDEAIIGGQIDLLKKVDETGDVTEVEIIDFKTEKDKEDRIYELDHIKQLRFYAIACLKSLGLNPKKACVHHLDKGQNKKEYVDISPKHLEQTKEEISGDVRDILEKNFPPKQSKICKNCDYRYICPYKNFKLGVEK